jgi:hypothetical protein
MARELAEVRAAISNLTEAWGGVYMPILDVRQSFKDVDLQARIFDVDAVHLEGTEGDLVDELRRTGWLWGGRGDFGPFASEDGFRTGVLPARVVDLDQESTVLPEWDATDDLDLLFTALFGSMSSPAGAGSSNRSDADETTRVGVGALMRLPDVTAESIGAIQATRVGVSPSIRYDLEGFNGVFVVRPGNVEDIVAFWNLRSFGRPIVAVPADGSHDLLSFLTRGDVPGTETRSGGPNPKVARHLGVWGLEDASTTTRAAIDAMAERLGMTAVINRGRRHQQLDFIFPGLDTRFESSVRAEFAPNARSVMIRVPSVPILPGEHQVMPGTVAVDIEVNSVSRLDPRSTASLPPFRRFGSVLVRNGGLSAADHVRIRADGDGVVLGTSARSDEVPLGFAYNLDAIHALFDDEDLKISQSDDGRFQTRAAEMLGGPFGGRTLQPGVRAVIEKAARSSAGLTLQQLKAEVKNNRGDWPDRLTSFRTSVDEYVENTVNYLLFTGLFVPMLDVHCSNCRVESQVAPRDLDISIQCEFCGEPFRLALSLSLSRSKSRWRYRLASHLGQEKVKALLPALATMSLLGELGSRFGPDPTHAFGVDFKFDRKRVEADVVVYLGAHDWTAVLGEVKNSNRIDANDVQNLEELQRRLDDKSVRSILAFVTLKDRFAPEEVGLLRGLVERSTGTTTAYGQLVPRLPLVLTARDLSVPWDHDEHPSRRTQPGSGSGIFATAIESCKRNLGLAERNVRPADGVGECGFVWQSPEPEIIESG